MIYRQAKCKEPVEDNRYEYNDAVRLRARSDHCARRVEQEVLRCALRDDSRLIIGHEDRILQISPVSIPVC